MGKEAGPSLYIVDSQSVKNTDTAAIKGYDGGKKISGIKRHIAVDSQGLPHGIYITPANITDRSGAISMLESKKEELVGVKKILVDGGYSGKNFAFQVQAIIQGIEVEVVKKSEMHSFKVIPKRWIVERSFAWLEKCRRLWKNCERKIESSLQFVVLAFLRLCVNRL